MRGLGIGGKSIRQLRRRGSILPVSASLHLATFWIVPLWSHGAQTKGRKQVYKSRAARVHHFVICTARWLFQLLDTVRVQEERCTQRGAVGLARATRRATKTRPVTGANCYGSQMGVFTVCIPRIFHTIMKNICIPMPPHPSTRANSPYSVAELTL
ncbi:hypothetical protein PLICRDRAFT_495138 [Plicaturopsis crispa FD-325 SS-3]|uniref:Uncharacterized protein n=1 Tax=Plicaturopsis crispa FD-325 SS-3 TaxID=944288 RepID=A0A0C9T1A6_PLICR|nr:hypothetical protein PLICRDRAFT_495138 [Plicaturopsis crispa FD-325 SS-3]